MARQQLKAPAVVFIMEVITSLSRESSERPPSAGGPTCPTQVRACKSSEPGAVAPAPLCAGFMRERTRMLGEGSAVCVRYGHECQGGSAKVRVCVWQYLLLTVAVCVRV